MPAQLEKYTRSQKAWRASHPVEAKQATDTWRSTNAERYRATVSAAGRRWRAAHSEEERTRKREMDRRLRAADVGYRMKYTLRHRVADAVRRGGSVKSARTQMLIGCSVPGLLGYLEEQFQPGMSWENYGEWHVDHIRPCSSFDLTDPAQQLLCFHYTNLQPLWAKDNFKKGDSWQ